MKIGNLRHAGGDVFGFYQFNFFVTLKKTNQCITISTFFQKSLFLGKFVFTVKMLIMTYFMFYRGVCIENKMIFINKYTGSVLLIC